LGFCFERVWIGWTAEFDGEDERGRVSELLFFEGRVGAFLSGERVADGWLEIGINRESGEVFERFGGC
jgi:hypothetical protein